MEQTENIDWKEGNIRVSSDSKRYFISDRGMDDLIKVMKNEKNIKLFLDHIQGGNCKYKFDPGTFCK
jgi:hypothetical protein